MTNLTYHERTKHIEIDYYFIREQINVEVVKTIYVKSSEQLANIFTRSLGWNQQLLSPEQVRNSEHISWGLSLRGSVKLQAEIPNNRDSFIIVKS